MNKFSLDCYKLLINFQISEKVDFDNFVNVIITFYGVAGFWISTILEDLSPSNDIWRHTWTNTGSSFLWHIPNPNPCFVTPFFSKSFCIQGLLNYQVPSWCPYMWQCWARISMLGSFLRLHKVQPLNKIEASLHTGCKYQRLFC